MFNTEITLEVPIVSQAYIFFFFIFQRICPDISCETSAKKTNSQEMSRLIFLENKKLLSPTNFAWCFKV